MKTQESLSALRLPLVLVSLLSTAALSARATTVWNGPEIGFYHTDANGLQDQLTTGVKLTRSTTGGGLYNSVTESGATSGISPADTAWAVGILANYPTLTYGPCPLEAGNHPPGYVGTTFVVHLINEDIYFSLTLTNWGGAFGAANKTFGYTRSTPASTSPAPTVSITNPAGGSVFASPAHVAISADATVSGGSVTNVEFFTNGISAGSVQAAPFILNVSGLSSGSYDLTAAATATGISATSVVVSVSVVSPVAVSLSEASMNGGSFSFIYNANTGLTYVVQSSSNLLDWTSLETNIAPANLVPFSDSLNSNAANFYRVGLRPNP